MLRSGGRVLRFILAMSNRETSSWSFALSQPGKLVFCAATSKPHCCGEIVGDFLAWGDVRVAWMPAFICGSLRRSRRAVAEFAQSAPAGDIR